MSYGITEYPNTFKRQDSFPLDSTSVFNNMESALEYVSKSNSTAYAGQIISIKNETTYDIYVVQIINDTKVLVNIIPNVLDYLKYKVGNYCLYNRISNLNTEFSFDINYPLKASYYSVYLNESEEPIIDLNNNSIFTIGQSFITTPIIFEQDNVFRIKLLDEDNNELLTLYSKKVFDENENVKFGILSLIK